MSTNTAIETTERTKRIAAAISVIKQDYSPDCLRMVSTIDYVVDAVGQLIDAGLIILRSESSLEAAQPADQQGEGELPQIPPHPDKYMTWREDEIEAIKNYTHTAIAQRAGSGAAESANSPIKIAMEPLGKGSHGDAQLESERASSVEAKPTDISSRLRKYAGNPGYSHNDYADTMRVAAEEIERYYGGMLAWKQTAETKDRKLSEEITARIDERVAARLAQPDSERDAVLLEALKQIRYCTAVPAAMTMRQIAAAALDAAMAAQQGEKASDPHCPFCGLKGHHDASMPHPEVKK